MGIFQNSVLRNQKQDESLVALRWAQFQNYISKIDFIKTVKEEKFQDSFLKDVFENCLEQVEPIYFKVSSNSKQIQTLENLRDTLLPKLLSGKASVHIG